MKSTTCSGVHDPGGFSVRPRAVMPVKVEPGTSKCAVTWQTRNVAQCVSQTMGCARTQTQDDQPVEQFEPDRRNDEQIDAGDIGGVIAQESLPAAFGSKVGSKSVRQRRPESGCIPVGSPWELVTASPSFTDAHEGPERTRTSWKAKSATYRGMRINGERVPVWSSQRGWSGL